MADGEDVMKYEILADGTIKFTTDSVSAPNHVSAEQFLRLVAEMAGGEVKTVRRSKSMHTHDEHTHDHDHLHEGH